MKLSISNIGWREENDSVVYDMLKQYGFGGLEIAPTRIFPELPYDKLYEAKQWSEKMKSEYGFQISSMQSIWYGRQEKIFGNQEERESLIQYTQKAINFAEAVGCKNLVFGCPRNRVVSENWNQEQIDEIAVPFFKELGEYAFSKGTVLAMEANPPIYNTNYINDTLSAIELIEKVASKGFLLNLDIGTMIENNESVEELAGKVHFINHVHISEPNLKVIQERQIHKDLIKLLEKEKYEKFISIEMGKQENLYDIEKSLKYAGGII